MRYRNPLQEMETSPRETYPPRKVRTLREKFQARARDNHYWHHRSILHIDYKRSYGTSKFTSHGAVSF